MCPDGFTWVQTLTREGRQDATHARSTMDGILVEMGPDRLTLRPMPTHEFDWSGASTEHGADHVYIPDFRQSAAGQFA